MRDPAAQWLYKTQPSLRKTIVHGNSEYREREDPEGDIRGIADESLAFGRLGQEGYRDTTSKMRRAVSGLERLARGRDSFSAEQLRQSLGQTLAAQQSMAAGARPANAAMAARTAAVQMGRQQAGLAGQQALAGIAERTAAQQALGQLLSTQRGQDIGVAQGGMSTALSGLQGLPQPPNNMQWLVPTITAAGMAMSDRRAKTDVKTADADADALVDGLKAYTWRYKDERHGTGRQIGIMAQDLERSKLGKQAVIDTPDGKIVHGAKLATALAAGLASMNKRMKKLEGK